MFGGGSFDVCFFISPWIFSRAVFLVDARVYGIWAECPYGRFYSCVGLRLAGTRTFQDENSYRNRKGLDSSRWCTAPLLRMSFVSISA